MLLCLLCVPPLLGFSSTPGGKAAELIRCALWADSPGCAFPPPPPRFAVQFECGQYGSFTLGVITEWQPIYATRLWQLVQLGYYEENPLYRFDYRNATQRFVVQYGANLLEGVQEVWERKRAINQSTPALVANTRGRLTFAMEAMVCNTSAESDPCEPYRPACTAEDYCAYGGSTQVSCPLQMQLLADRLAATTRPPHTSPSSLIPEADYCS